MPLATSRILFTLASLLFVFTFSPRSAEAFESTDAVSWADYYESVSGNDPVVRGITKTGSAAAGGIQVGEDLVNDVKRVNEGISRGQVLAGTITKYGTQFAMQSVINTVTGFASPVCARTTPSALACLGLFVSATEGADRLSDSYRASVESLFAEEAETPDQTAEEMPEDKPQNDHPSYTNSQWRMVAGVMRQDGGETSMDLPQECQEMGATDAFQMVAAGKTPEVEEGANCFSSKIINDSRDYVAVTRQCVFQAWGSTEVLSTTRAIDEDTVHAGTRYILPSGQQIEAFMVMERCE